jgi:hypothetical protein
MVGAVERGLDRLIRPGVTTTQTELAKNIVEVLAEAGFVIVPREPTEEMGEHTSDNETPRDKLERRLFALGVPVFSAPIQEAIDHLVAAAHEEGANFEREHSG